MTQPSNLKVKRLVELDALPEGAASEAWMYAVIEGNPNRDHKVNVSDLVLESTDVILAPIRDKLDELPTLKDFGAEGDGTTDDTEAVAEANATESMLYVPDGVYESDVAPEFRITGPGIIRVDGREYTQNDWMFGGKEARRTKRRVLFQLPLLFPDFAAAATAAGENPATGLYPQSFCIDWDGDRVFVVYSGSGVSAYHVVVAYHLHTQQYISCFLVPYTIAAEGSYIRGTGSNTVIGIHVGNFINEYSVSPMPSNLSFPDPANQISLSLSYQFSFSGSSNTLLVEESARPRGEFDRRNALSEYTLTGGLVNRVRLPIYVSSGRANEPLTDVLPKRQAMAYNGTHIATAHGSLWLSASADPIVGRQYNGVTLMNASGQVLEQVSYAPDKLRTKLAEVLGRSVTRCENEGVVFTPDGKVITLNVYLGHSSGSPSTGGLVFLEEFSEHPDAVDFAECETPWPLASIEAGIDTAIWDRRGITTSDCFYVNPLTGTPITSWNDICDVMRAFDLREAGYYSTHDGNGGVLPGGITTPLGARIPNTHYVHFVNVSNSVFVIRVIGNAGMDAYVYNRGTQNLVPASKPTVNASNTASALSVVDLNKTIEKSNTTAYSRLLPAGLGSQGDTVRVVNSGTAGNITITRDAGVVLVTGATDADLVVSPGTSKTIYRSATSNRWIVL